MLRNAEARFSYMHFKVLSPPHPTGAVLHLWGATHRGISRPTHWERSSRRVWLHTAGSAASPSDRAMSVGHAGSGLWKLCVQKWMIVQPSLLFKRDRGEESQRTYPWHPNFSLDEILTGDPFLFAFWLNKSVINLKASHIWGWGKWNGWQNW